MNKVIILGRMTRDPEVKYTQNGKCVATFTLAVDRPFRGPNGEKETDFIPVVLWNKQAEMVGNSCRQGHRLAVEGRLQIRTYDAKDGSKRWVTEVIGNAIDFIEKKENADYGAGAPVTSQGRSEMEAFGQAVPFDEDIPF